MDQLAHTWPVTQFGHQLLLPVPDLERTKLFLILGANPAVSNGSMMTAPGMSRRLQEIRARGGRVILIDPRYNETASLADQHLFIRPGTDVLLLLALLHVVFDEQLVRMDHVAQFTKGVERVAQLVTRFSPESVAAATGIEANKYVCWRANSRPPIPLFATAESASATQSRGVCQWLINF